MRLPLVTALAVMLVPALSLPQTHKYNSVQSNEELLLRRALTKTLIERRGDSQRGSSPTRQTRHNSATDQELPPLGRLSLGTPRASNRRLNVPPRPPSSSGDSDSSVERAGQTKSSKIKAKATGPASIRWETDFNPERIQHLAQGERFRQSIRGKAGADMSIITHKGSPPGKARMTTRGRTYAQVHVDGSDGGSGKITQLNPPDPKPDIVAAGTDKTAVLPRRYGQQETPKMKAEIQGPGEVIGRVLNRR